MKSSYFYTDYVTNVLYRSGPLAMGIMGKNILGSNLLVEPEWVFVSMLLIS